MRAQGRGASCTLVTREQGWDELASDAPGPVVVAVRNDDLDAVIERLPAHRRVELVFVQNGMIRPWLLTRGLSGSTRGLLFFAVPTRGAELQPGTPSPFTGPFAPRMVEWFRVLGLESREVDPLLFASVELEKLIWNSAFGLLCQAYDLGVGAVCDEHAEVLRHLTDELRRVGRASMGVDLDQVPLVNRLVAYSRTIPSYRGAVKEWTWRNGWFVSEAARLGVDTPIHLGLLETAGIGRSGPRERDVVEQQRR